MTPAQKLLEARRQLAYARAARLNQEWTEMYHHTAAAHALIVSARASLVVGRFAAQAAAT